MMDLSILLPVYNGEKYIKAAVESILGQTYGDFRLIIINDGSTDLSKSIIESFDDKRIIYLENDRNEGLIYSLNKGLSQISTKYMARMDADDISHRDRLKFLYRFMEENPSVGICGTKVGEISEVMKGEVRIIDDEHIRASHLINCSITHASAIYRMEILQKNTLKYEEKYKHSEDNALITDILSYSKGAILNHKLYWVRKHDQQVSQRFREIQKESSTKRRVELLREVFGVTLRGDEKRLYLALSYKEKALSLDDLLGLGKLVLRLESILIPNNKYKFRRDVFLKILYKRIDLIYLQHSYLGFPLFIIYQKLFFTNKNTIIGGRLFIKSLLKI